MASIPLPALNSSAKLSPITSKFTARSQPEVFNQFAVKFTLKNDRSRKRHVYRAAVFRDLDADDFRHPLDRQNTLLLRAIPGLNEIGKALLGTVAEQVMLLENIGTSVLVAENQLPELHQLMVEAAKILSTEAPDLYVRQSPIPNAYTLAISGKKPFVVVHTSLVELLTRTELQGPGGITVKKTNQALLIGIYDEPMTPGQCNMVVERLGDYLIDQGL